MEWSEEEWLSLVARSAFLHERHGSSYVPGVTTPEAAKQVENRMLQWKKNVANGNDQLFQRRLEWDGLSLAAATNLLRTSHFTCPVLPPWTNCLREVLRAFPEMAERPWAGDSPYASFLNAKPVAFEHLMVPFVEYASRTVVANPLTAELLENRALVDLQRFLLTQLCQCAISCLMVEFSAFRAVRSAKTAGTNEAGNSDKAEKNCEDSKAPSLYYLFIQRMWDGKFAQFLQSYPVLARMLAEYTEMWTRFVSEFLERLHADLYDLQKLLNDHSLCKIAQIEPGLSDRHNHGNVVLSLQTSSGHSFIYKPKDIDAERAYHHLLQWLNQHHLHLWPEAFQCLCRDGYGWVATLKPADCNTAEDLRKFYYRAGNLLGLFHAIGANDVHGENLLACGDYPALIDAETLLSPELRPISDNETASGLTTREFWDWSVFRTAMLPRWTAGQAKQMDTISGLVDTGSAPPQSTRICEFPNSDQMAIVQKTMPGRELRNVPRLDGRPVPAGEHVADIVSGFHDMYSFLMANHQAILAPGGPLEYFTNLPLRLVFRNTYIYSTLIGKLQRPEFLRDGAEASFLTEALYKFLLHEEAKSPMWEVVKSEIEAVLRGDIPIFNYRSSSDLLELEGRNEQVKCFVQSAYEAMKSRFQRLSAADRQLQICYIRSAFNCGVTVLQEENEALNPLTMTGSANSSTWQEAALAIAVEIRKAVRLGNDGTATWISRSFDPVAQTWKLRPMDSRFYDGIAGTAVFLAALEKITATSDFHDLLMGALNTIKSVASTLKWQSNSGQFLIGAGIGLTSISYGLVKIAELLQMEEALELARTYTSYLTIENIQSDANFDLMSGAAGSILALLAMQKLTGDNSLQEMAVECGHHLLKNRSVSGTGLRSWKTSQGKMLSGYSHGAAGIAHALTELFRVTSFEPFREAAIEACSFENTLFSKQRGNWATMGHLAGNGTPEFWNTWCHGAVGIGLGRIASFEVLGDSARPDIEEAIKTTLMEKFAPIDHACCGNMGSMELFLCANARFGGSVYMEKANQIGTSVLRRAEANGHYGLGTTTAFESPSFHQGTAGIGYQFLRLAAPRALPSILLWQ